MFIPVLSIEKIFVSAVSFIIAFAGYRKWQKEELCSFEYFFKGMLWLGVFCLTFVVHPLMSSNLYLIQAMWIFADSTFLASAGYFLALGLLFTELERFHSVAKRFFVTLAPTIPVIEALFFKKALAETYLIPFRNSTGIGWISSFPFGMWWGILATLLMVVFIPFITKGVMGLAEPSVRRKGVFIIAGLSGLALACIWLWLVRPLYGPSFWIEVSQGIFCVSGQLFFALGMLSRNRD